MVALSSFEVLPLEIIRNVAYFCSDIETTLVLPMVSKRLYDACNDRELLRNVFQRELCRLVFSDRDVDSNGQQSVSLFGTNWSPYLSLKSGPLIDRGSRSFANGPQYWARWIIALRMMQNATSTWSIPHFPGFIGLMQYLPHLLLLGVPLPYSEVKRKWLIELFAFYYLDVTGPPAFRSRFYSQELDRQELNLRMALCLTVLALQRENIGQFFEKVEILGDQSIASWLASAIIGSRDYLWSKNYNEPLHKKRAIDPQAEALSTVTSLAASLIHHYQIQDVVLPDTSKLPLFANPDMSKYPVPFDVLHSPVYPEASANPRAFKEMISAQQKEFLESNTIAQGRWCGYYLLSRPHDLTEFLFSPLIEGIKFHSNKTAPGEWELVSDPFEDVGEEFQFTGIMKGDEHFCEIILDRQASGVTEHWHGQLSAFGMSGGYSIHHESGLVFPGGLFWLWMEDWSTLPRASSNETS